MHMLQDNFMVNMLCVNSFNQKRYFLEYRINQT